MVPTNLFGDPVDHKRHGLVSVLPVSVIDVGKQGARSSSHDAESSRVEYSPFPAEINALCWDLYLKGCNHVFDPFAGWGERGAAGKQRGIGYTGYDISDASIASAARLDVTNLRADSRVVAPPDRCDGLITCPPYWNLEDYSPNGLDALPSWDEFIDGYRSVLSLSARSLLSGSVFCVLTGDWRKDGQYFDLTFHTQRILTELGLIPVDVVIANRRDVTKIKIMIPQAVRLGYTVKVHETLSVYRLP